MPTDNRGYVWPQWYIEEIKRSDPIRYAELMGKGEEGAE